MGTEKMNIVLKEENLSVRAKISFLWGCAMFLFIYADLKAFFETGFIQQVINGNLAGMIINQNFLLISAMLMTIPPIMIVLTIFTKASLNRIINIIISTLEILLAASLLIFAPIRPWYYFIWYSCFEILFLGLVVFLSIKWPKES